MPCLPMNVDRQPPLQQGLMDFQLQNFHLKQITKRLIPRETVNFLSTESGNKIIFLTVSLGTSH